MRVKTGTTRRQRHNKLLNRAKGFRMTRSRLYKVAHEAVMHAGQYAFIGRKLRKRDMRKLWITRINAAARQNGLTYSEFMNLLKKSEIKINRKMLAHLAATDADKFKSIVESVKNK
jgi:large subunit ribosomal protein L20